MLQVWLFFPPAFPTQPHTEATTAKTRVNAADPAGRTGEATSA